jgi:predicted ATP-dependent endonuclease of OLD family
MLQNIQIQNFRCFEDFKAEGFERVNLIGGKNNSGKTCLLEGIYLSKHNPSFHLTDFINGRKSNSTSNEDKDSNTNLRFTKNVNDPIVFIFKEGNSVFTRNFLGHGDMRTRDEFYDELQFHPNIKLLYDKNTAIPKSDELAIAFSKADRKGHSKMILETLRILDDRIEEIKPYPDTSILYLKTRESKLPIPVNYFGDAIQSMLRYVIAFSDFEPNDYGNILLIDEIENGLHYTAHEDFWKNIFKLSKELNVQIFATTHSLEMIQQFNKVAKEFELENPEDKGAYFEMVRDEKTNQIEAIKHSTNILEEELDMNLGIRGEVFKDKISITPELLQTLNNAVKNAQTNLKSNNIPVPFIKDGWIWETLPDGTEQKLEELQTLNLK